MKSIRSGGKSACINPRYKADKANSVVGLLVGYAPKSTEIKPVGTQTEVDAAKRKARKDKL